MRLGLFDEQIAIMPMHDTGTEGDGFRMLEVRNEGLARGMTEIFDAYWAQGDPL